MTDNEYIRKAVELADGWEVTDTGDIISPIAAYVGEPMHQCFLDALAAQLVRQVDALPEPIRVLADRSCECGAGRSFTVVGTRHSNDRTMNTIKAIVDSEVLK